MPRGKKRSEEEIEKFVQTLVPVLQRGTSLDNACKYTGIPRMTVYDYMEKYEWVRKKITTAMSYLDIVAETKVADSIIEGNVGDAKWRLERNQKDKYSLRHETTGKNGEPLQLDIHSALHHDDITKPVDAPSIEDL